MKIIEQKIDNFGYSKVFVREGEKELMRFPGTMWNDIKMVGGDPEIEIRSVIANENMQLDEEEIKKLLDLLKNTAG